MNDADRKPFYQAWAAAWEQCGKTVTERMLRFAFETLQAYPLADLQQGILAHARDPDQGQFPPKPADIIRQIEGGGDEASSRAWAKVEQAVTQVGPWKPVTFDDPVIHVVIEEMGGLMPLMSANHDEWNIMRSWFTKTYRAYRQRPVARHPAILWSESGRRDQLVFIGDPDRARAVLEGGDKGAGQLTQAAELRALLPAAKKELTA